MSREFEGICNSDSREPFIEGGWAGGGWFHFRRDLGEEEGIFRRVFGVLGWGEWTKYDRSSTGSG